MATKAEWVTTLKAQSASLQKMVDGVKVSLSTSEYEATIDDWATVNAAKDVYNAVQAAGGESADYVQLRTDPRSGYGYKGISDQLDLLYKDIAAGKLGEDAKTGGWYLDVKAVKDKYTKP
jgi:hypothetical protein|tara:strand:+ start:845 stop:1204 length:360 start_codon:yes stop_codon:yes gene_type:complete